jgi:hypothetical protein|nr:MAG TPA: hypothetical protein [Caudoviricetes sp.]
MGNVNCLRCHFRHEDNGNCTAVGGFCTAVSAAHCPLLREYLDTELTPEEINDLASVREISPEAEYAINKHADNIIERLDKLLHQTDDDARLRELAEADKDGRLVVLPCKVGQRVFALLDTDKHISECEVKQIGLGNEIGFVGIEPIGARGREYGVSIKGFGKTVFLTREAAEAALEAMKNE